MLGTLGAFGVWWESLMKVTLSMPWFCFNCSWRSLEEVDDDEDSEGIDVDDVDEDSGLEWGVRKELHMLRRTGKKTRAWYIPNNATRKKIWKIANKHNNQWLNFWWPELKAGFMIELGMRPLHCQLAFLHKIMDD